LYCSLLAALAIAAVYPKRGLWRLIAIPAAVGALGVAVYYGTPATAWLLPLIAAANICYFTWFYNRAEEAPPAEALATKWSRPIAAGLLLLAMFFSLTQTLVAVPIDLFHQGEVVLSARSWLHGGKPFEDLFWPHGLHDSWLTALVMRWTGNEGLGAVVLARAATHLLGIAALYLIARNLLRRRLDAAWLTLVLAIVATPEVYGLMPLVYSLGVNFFAVLLLHLVAHRSRERELFVAGLVMSWGYLWRFDSGVFAAAAAVGYLIFEEYYAAFHVGDSAWSLVRRSPRNLLPRLSILLTGGLTLLALAWAVTGVPTWAMLKTTLWLLPKYHADNTGFPLPLPIQGFEQFPYTVLRFAHWLMGHYLLFAAAMLVFLLVKARQRKLSLAGAEDRFFLLFVMFNLLYLKTVLDRSDPPFRIEFAFGVLSILVVFDGLARGLVPGSGWQAAAWKRLTVQTAAAVLVFGLVIPKIGTAAGWGLADLKSRLSRTAQRLAEVPAMTQAAAACFRPARDGVELLEPSSDPNKAQVLEGIRELRAVLDAWQIGERQFVAVHSGPFLYPLVGRTTPTKYYLLGWAMTEPMQREAVHQLESNRVRAILRVNGLGGTLPIYDVPDEHRVPLIHSYLQAQIDRSTACPLRLGTLYIEGLPPDRQDELGRRGAAASSVGTR
jgi:hypothetical protein